MYREKKKINLYALSERDFAGKMLQLSFTLTKISKITLTFTFPNPMEWTFISLEIPIFISSESVNMVQKKLS